MTTWKKRTAAMELLGFVVGRCAVFGVNPIGVGYFLGLCGHDINKGLLALSLLLGMMTVLEGVEVIKYALIIGTITVILQLFCHTGKKVTPFVRYVTGGIVTAALSLSKGAFTADYKTGILLSLLEGCLVGISGYLLQSGCSYLLYHRKRTGMSNQELVSMGLLVGVLLYALPAWSFFEASVPWILVYLTVLFAGYKYGSGAGAVVGAACGMAMSFQSGETVLIGSLCILGICGGMFAELGKLGASIAFAVTGASLGFLYYPTLIEMVYLKNLLAGAALFAFIPVKYLEPVRFRQGENEEAAYMKQNLQWITKHKFKSFSDSLTKLSRSFDQFSKPKQMFGYQEVNDIFEEISGKFCKDCVYCEECWSRNYEAACESAQMIFSAARENGKISKEDIPLEFMNRCINVGAFVRETNKSLELARVNLGWYNRLKESREAVAEQLGGMAQVMKDFAADVCEITEVKNELEDQMTEKLRRQHIDVKRLIMLENRRKQKEIHLIARMKWGRCVTSREVAVMLSQVLGTHMRPAEYTKNVVPKETEALVFVEDTKYKTLTGVARKSKEGEAVSGDNFSFLELRGGQLAMILSDGMGSGREANEESEEVIELLEQMMETGIREQTAIQLLNSLYALWSDSRSFSTIDMGMIDLYTGSTRFIKMGAAASFIKKKDGIERIESASLPAGMLQQIETETSSVQVEDGDFVIMVTDGILDSFAGENKEECLELILSEVESNNPQEMAETILEKVLEVSEKAWKDDMTVLAAGVWEKY